ncbi:MAG: hypothetical protein IKA36_01305 [Clostridia bacterium]|nr:hypothetical protein [Clostridia bacterium]
MREIALACKIKNEDIIDFLHTNVVNRIDFCKCVITRYCDDNFSYLLFACDEMFAFACEKILREIIIEYIESVYKVGYLKAKIKNPLSNTLPFNAYIKILAVFDKTTDENALSNIILLNQTFFVDSFIDFRLAPLKKHWNNLIELSSDNLMFFNSGTFVDLIRYLLNTMDNIVYKVKVICDGENFSVYNMKNKNAKITKTAECHNSMDLISNILTSCPSYIDIYVKNVENSEAVSFLSNVYTNRLKIYMRN